MSWFTDLLRKSPAKSVLLEPSKQQFEVSGGETVLERALQKGIAYPHDCTVGTCGSCRSKLLSGKVEAITPFSYTLSKEEIAAGYILACQAVAKSDLVLEVDTTAGGEIAPEPRTAKLVGVDDLTHDIKRLRWEVSPPLRYRAGQYVNVRWNGSSAHRSYSLATAPLPGGQTEISTFIRHVPGGAFTDLLFKGDPFDIEFELEGPHGNFWLREGTGPILCIAGGSGLAPLISLLQDGARRRVRRDCILLFGARRMRDVYAAEEIAAVREAWTAGFDYWPVLSEEEASGYRHGLVTEFVLDALQRLGPGAHGYMCGPPGMIDSGINALLAQEIALTDIHYDKFTDASTGINTTARKAGSASEST
jgi:p-cymene monooxygenase electron transfer component